MKAKKGIVVESGKNKAIILLPGGEYRKVRTGGKYLEAGDLYEYNNTPMIKYAVAAVLLLVLIAGGVDYNLVKAYASLGSDLELGINRWGRVVSVQAKSPEGQQILDSVEIKNDTIEFAVKRISEQVKEEGTINPQGIRENLKVITKGKSNLDFANKIIKEMEKGLEKADKKNIKEIEKDLRKADKRNKNESKNNNESGNSQNIKEPPQKSNSYLPIMGKQSVNQGGSDNGRGKDPAGKKIEKQSPVNNQPKDEQSIKKDDPKNETPAKINELKNKQIIHQNNRDKQDNQDKDKDRKANKD